jgi:hypothetical protein
MGVRVATALGLGAGVTEAGCVGNASSGDALGEDGNADSVDSGVAEGDAVGFVGAAAHDCPADVSAMMGGFSGRLPRPHALTVTATANTMPTPAEPRHAENRFTRKPRRIPIRERSDL